MHIENVYFTFDAASISQHFYAWERLTERGTSKTLEVRTTVRKGDFGRDAQFSLTYGRMYQFPIANPHVA